MKKCRTVLSILAALLLCTQGALASSSPLLYEVTDAEGHCVYLLGTMHMGTEDMYPLGDAVEKAYRESDALAVEFDLLSIQEDMARLMQYSLALMYTDGTDIRDHISPEIYRMGLEQLGQPALVLNRMRPIAWMTLAEEASFSRLGCSAEYAVDTWLLDRAHREGKTIFELESLDEQIDVLLSTPEDFIEYQLEQAFINPQKADLSVQLLITAWRQGNAVLLERLLNEEDSDALLPPELLDSYAAYTDTLLHARDERFEKKVKEYLKNGDKVFFAVGAAHIVGEGALADRLAQDGYTVREIGR